ncbi:MAG TPA: hypothetical protein VMH81_38860 [Bryobacteraceae bacterium]|nr:hypothetical protein [Bryobacteraceae bacterium]
MRCIALCSVLAIRLAAQPGAGDAAKADEVLKAARAALGPRLSNVQSLSVWGADHRGLQSTQLALTLDLSGKCLKEQSSLSNGGQIQRMGLSADGAGPAGGGMPGDDGGPAMSLLLTEGLDGDDYWARNGVGSGKQPFINGFVRYVLAFTLSPPADFPVEFTYGGRIESPRGTVDALEGKGGGGFLVHLYLDAKDHLPVTMVYHDGGEETQLWLKDYKSEDGIRFPHTLVWIFDDTPVEEFQIQHFKVNPKLRPDKFRR